MTRIWLATALAIALPTLANASCADDDLWICKLKPYEPDPGLVSTDNTSPKCDGAASTGLKNKIQDAYDAIPADTLQRFKNQLCQVEHIFVTSGLTVMSACGRFCSDRREQFLSARLKALQQAKARP